MFIIQYNKVIKQNGAKNGELTDESVFSTRRYSNAD